MVDIPSTIPEPFWNHTWQHDYESIFFNIFWFSEWYICITLIILQAIYDLSVIYNCINCISLCCRKLCEACEKVAKTYNGFKHLLTRVIEVIENTTTILDKINTLLILNVKLKLAKYKIESTLNGLNEIQVLIHIFVERVVKYLKENIIVVQIFSFSQHFSRIIFILDHYHNTLSICREIYNETVPVLEKVDGIKNTVNIIDIVQLLQIILTTITFFKLIFGKIMELSQAQLNIFSIINLYLFKFKIIIFVNLFKCISKLFQNAQKLLDPPINFLKLTTTFDKNAIVKFVEDIFEAVFCTRISLKSLYWYNVGKVFNDNLKLIDPVYGKPFVIYELLCDTTNLLTNVKKNTFLCIDTLKELSGDINKVINMVSIVVN